MRLLLPLLPSSILMLLLLLALLGLLPSLLPLDELAYVWVDRRRAPERRRRKRLLPLHRPARLLLPRADACAPRVRVREELGSPRSRRRRRRDVGLGSHYFRRRRQVASVPATAASRRTGARRGPLVAIELLTKVERVGHRAPVHGAVHARWRGDFNVVRRHDGRSTKVTMTRPQPSHRRTKSRSTLAQDCTEPSDQIYWLQLNPSCRFVCTPEPLSKTELRRRPIHKITPC